MRVQGVSLRRRRVTQDVRDRIVLENLSLVKAIAIRVHENLPVHVDVDDLIHAGVLGLFDAVGKYDAAKNVAFRSYAKHRIKGAILDSLRQLDWASRDMRKRRPISSRERYFSTIRMSAVCRSAPTAGRCRGWRRSAACATCSWRRARILPRRGR